MDFSAISSACALFEAASTMPAEASKTSFCRFCIALLLSPNATINVVIPATNAAIGNPIPLAPAIEAMVYPTTAALP